MLEKLSLGRSCNLNRLLYLVDELYPRYVLMSKYAAFHQSLVTETILKCVYNYRIFTGKLFSEVW